MVDGMILMPLGFDGAQDQMTDLERLDLIFNLTPEQRAHVDSLLWLFGDERQQGRTTLILYTFMRMAIEDPAYAKQVIDHITPTRTDERRHGQTLRDMMEMFLARDMDLFRRTRLTLGGTGKLYIAVREKPCVNCHKGPSQHGDKGKCLFESTFYSESEADDD